MSTSHEPAESPAQVDAPSADEQTPPLHETIAAILGLEPEELRPPARHHIRN